MTEYHYCSHEIKFKLWFISALLTISFQFRSVYSNSGSKLIPFWSWSHLKLLLVFLFHSFCRLVREPLGVIFILDQTWGKLSSKSSSISSSKSSSIWGWLPRCETSDHQPAPSSTVGNWHTLIVLFWFAFISIWFVSICILSCNYILSFIGIFIRQEALIYNTWYFIYW